MPKHKPLPVRVHFQNSSTKFEEKMAMADGEAIILTGDGLMEGKTTKNMYTSKYFWLEQPVSNSILKIIISNNFIFVCLFMSSYDFREDKTYMESEVSSDAQ